MWFKVDDQLAFNAKVVAAGNEAMGLWVRCGSWSSAQLTDGFIPTHMANAMANGMANGMANECGADALVMAGLWDEVEGGYQFHDWAEFQPNAASEREKRKKRSIAGQKGAEARWGGKSDSKSHSKSHNDRMANECEVDAPSRPVPSRPIPTPNGVGDAPAKPKPANRKTRIPDDWAPNESHAEKAAELGIDLHAEASNFRDHAIANGKTFVDWSRGFHTWLNNALKFGLRPGVRPSGRDSPRTFDQIRHDQNLELWSRVKAEEEGADPWQRQLGA